MQEILIQLVGQVIAICNFFGTKLLISVSGSVLDPPENILKIIHTSELQLKEGRFQKQESNFELNRLTNLVGCTVRIVHPCVALNALDCAVHDITWRVLQILTRDIGQPRLQAIRNLLSEVLCIVCCNEEV